MTALALYKKETRTTNNNNNSNNNIIQFPTHGRKRVGQSTTMDCLHNRDEIIALYNEFKVKYDNARTVAKQRTALRNLTMFVCSITIGLRGGDFCSLRWSDLFNDDWTFKVNADFVPEKTIRYNEHGEIVKAKHVRLSWNTDMEHALIDWLNWKMKNDSVDINDHIFTSQKGDGLTMKAWYKIVEKTRKDAGIQQKIGTHGLRKTMANQYIKNAEDKKEAIMEVCSMFNHSDLRVTERYACIEAENISDNKERMAFLY